MPGRFLVLFALGRQEGSRVGITATRRLGSAVVRNRVRRRVRELARHHWTQVAALAADVVVNARQAGVGATWAELEADFLDCLRRTGRRLQRAAPSSES